MQRIPALEPTRANADVRTTLDAVKAKLGMVPNIVRTMTRAPSVLNGCLAFSGAVGTGELTAKQREIVALAVAQANERSYCLSAHTLMGKGAGLSPEGIRKAHEGRAESALDDAVASFARRVVDARGQVSDADLAAARSTGLGDGTSSRSSKTSR